VSGILLPLRVNSLPLATIYEVKIPLRKWKKSLLQRNPAQMTWAIIPYFRDLQIFISHPKAEHFCQFREAIKNWQKCSALSYILFRKN
jgi:hypothetical protein